MYLRNSLSSPSGASPTRMPFLYSRSYVPTSTHCSLTRRQNGSLSLNVPNGTASWYTSTWNTRLRGGGASFGSSADELPACDIESAAVPVASPATGDLSLFLLDAQPASINAQIPMTNK